MTRIDLHGKTIHVAWKETDTFLTESYFNGHKTVTVICGQGMILREIHNWFDNHPRVRGYSLKPNGGSFSVKLKKKP